MNYALSVVVFLLLFVLAVAVNFSEGSFNAERLALFVDFPSLLITLVPALFFSAGATSWGALGTALKAAFGPTGGVGREALADGKRCLVVMGNTAAIVGALGTLIGAVIILQHLSEWGALAPASAIALLTLLYGFVIKLFCYVAARKIACLLET